MKNLVLLLAASAIIFSCSTNDRETASGQKFLVIKKGDGAVVDSGKFMIMNFLFKDAKDSIWNDTRKSGFPLIMQKQGIVRPGDKVLEVINMLSKGDSVSFKVTAAEIFSKSFRQPVPPGVDSTSNFTFEVGLSDVMDNEQYQKFRQELMTKQNEKMLNEKKIQLGKDTLTIDQFLAEKNLKPIKTKSGLRYIITKPGTGEAAKIGQNIKVNYAGHLLNGKYFDTSIEPIAKEQGLYQAGKSYAPLDFKFENGMMIEGWTEILQLMNKGSKLTVYIPSTLGYGNMRRSEVIVENSILVFDMEMVDIK